jgi:hypothetical protein
MQQRKKQKVMLVLQWALAIRECTILGFLSNSDYAKAFSASFVFDVRIV